MNARPEPTSFAGTVAVRMPPGPELLWRALLDVSRLSPQFAVASAAMVARSSEWAMEDYIQRLHRAGAVSRAGRSTAGETLWQLNTRRNTPFFLDRKGREDRAHQAIDALWRAIKMVKSFTLRELVHHASLPSLPITAETAKSFAAALAEAGYLVTHPASGEDRFRLVEGMATGPLPPRVCKAVFVYDRNRGYVVNRELVAEEVRL
jgi:hypothetical protein